MPTMAGVQGANRRVGARGQAHAQLPARCGRGSSGRTSGAPAAPAPTRPRRLSWLQGCCRRSSPRLLSTSAGHRERPRRERTQHPAAEGGAEGAQGGRVRHGAREGWGRAAKRPGGAHAASSTKPGTPPQRSTTHATNAHEFHAEASSTRGGGGTRDAHGGGRGVRRARQRVSVPRGLRGHPAGCRSTAGGTAP
jgi:hypothetical protein